MKNKINKFKNIARFINLNILEHGEIIYIDEIEDKLGDHLDSYIDKWSNVIEFWIPSIMDKLEELGCRCYIRCDFVAIYFPKITTTEIVEFKDYPDKQKAILECCYRAIITYNKSLLIEEDV